MTLKPFAIAIAVSTLAAAPAVATPPPSTMNGTVGAFYFGVNSNTTSIDVGSVLTASFGIFNLWSGDFNLFLFNSLLPSALTASNGSIYSFTSGLGDYTGTVTNVLSSGPQSSRVLTAYTLGTFTPANFLGYQAGPASVTFEFTQNGPGNAIQGTLELSSPPAPAPAVPEPSAWAMLIAGFGLTGAMMRRRRTAVAA